jgi:putative CocE/NonD family hydrolase
MSKSASALAERREVDCVLSDGTALHTVILLPAGLGPWPALLIRHPYDVTDDTKSGRVDVERFVAAGYLVALQDVRGRFGSTGEFDPSASEAADGADAVAWLAALPECTGVVGMWGASYASETQFSALLGGSPALRSIVPAVTPVASGRGGFRFRGGVPEVGSMTAWSHFAIAPNQVARISDAAEHAAEATRWSRAEGLILDGELFRAGGLTEPLDVDATLAWMRDRLTEPLDSPAHWVGKVAGRIDAIDVPVFLIGGWFDVFLGSTLEVYRQLRDLAATSGSARPHLLIGPWSHDNMSGTIGDLDFGSDASQDDLGGDGDLTAQHLRWFDATLRGASSLDGVPPVRIYLMGADRWLELTDFPPADAMELELHLAGDGRLGTLAGPTGSVTFVSDPSNPVATTGGATLLFPPYAPGPVDQSAIEERPDVVSWRSEPMTDELAIIGAVRALVHVATTGTDADVVVRLCDEHPDGRTLLVADGIQRGSARAVGEWGEAGPVVPLEPGQVAEYTVDLWSTAHAFLPGHRIRIDVTSSSSPRWDIGVNTFVPPGVAPVPLVAELTLSFGAAHPSRLILTVPRGTPAFPSTPPRTQPNE